MFSKVVNYDNIQKKQELTLSISEKYLLRKTTEEEGWGGGEGAFLLSIHLLAKNYPHK